MTMMDVSGWMFLLAHPGCPGEKPESRKTVVCVHVCLLHIVVSTTCIISSVFWFRTLPAHEVIVSLSRDGGCCWLCCRQTNVNAFCQWHWSMVWLGSSRLAFHSGLLQVTTLHIVYHSHTHTHHNRFTALWILSGTTRVSRYQKKHSPTHTHCGHQISLLFIISFLKWLDGCVAWNYKREFQVKGWERETRIRWTNLDTTAKQVAMVYWHVLRKEDNDWVKKCMEYEVDGAGPKGRPKKTWWEIVERDCQASKLNKEDVMDHKRWRKQIRDDLMTAVGVSGWMFLLVSAHPGCPGQSPLNHQMVVVVVIVFVVQINK